jgi:hypothetical protein
MTVELDNVITNLQDGQIELELCSDEDGNAWVYIGTNSGSGAEYKVQSIQDVADMLKFYLTNYYSGEPEFEDEEE